MRTVNIPDRIYDTVIIGAGPAGLTAGLYAARAGLKTLVIEGASTVSQITVTDRIENYPGMVEGLGGFELIQRFKSQTLKFGAQVKSADVTSLARTYWDTIPGWEVFMGDQSCEALSLIVATGAEWRKLGVPGEMEYLGRGVSYCATCDGPMYRNKKVVVIGGGDTAVQEALFLTNFAKKVTIVHRRDRLRAAKILQQRALSHEKIEFAWDSVLEEISGGDIIEKVILRNVKTSAVREIPADGVFIFIGLSPRTDLVRGIVDLDTAGYILVDAHMQTSVRGIFACGDCISKRLRQVVTACGDGATAAFSAHLYVEEIKGDSY